ncbi:MAG TPA: NCS2 family permease [Vicinamibacterales bacterium]
MIERVFALQARGTTVAREVRASLATFLTMAYILVANPAILTGAGIPFEAAVAATALTAGLCCLLMGLGANFPLALAPGMGLNAFVAYQLTPALGSWQAAMGLVVIDGLVVLALVLLGLREAVMRAIPLELRRAIAVGIGLFIAFLGLVNARLVVVPASTVAVLGGNPQATLPPVTHGAFTAAEPLVAIVGVLVTAWLLVRRVGGAVLIGIGAAALAAFLLGLAVWPASIAGAPRFDTLFQADVATASHVRHLPLLFSIVLVDFFDTIGTVTAVGDAAHLSDAEGRVPRLRRILAIDALSATIGGAMGASSATAYIESSAGVAEGARTGLHTVCVGVLFLLAILLAPLLAMVPPAAAASALIVTGFLMCQQITRIDFAALETAIPAFLVILLVPLTYSISHGIGAGFVAYVVIRLLNGRWREIHPLMAASAIAFTIYFAAV